MAARRSVGLPASITARRLVVGLSATTFLLWIGASAILPLLPSYLRARGSSPGVVGLVMSAYFAASVVTQYPVGRLSDRIGHKVVIAGGLVVFAAGSVGFALASAPVLTIAFRALEGVGAGAVTVASAAALGSLVGASERGGAFGALYGSQMLALAVGPLVGSIVGASSMRSLFLGAAGFAVAALVPVLVVLARAGAMGPTDRPAAPVGGSARATRLGSRGALVGVVIVFASTGLLAGVYESCWTLLLRLRHASSFEIGLSWTLFALPFAVLSVPAGRLAGRIDRRRLAVGALLSSALFCALYPLLHVVGLLVGLGLVEAAGAVLGAPAAVLILAESTPSSSQGAAQGIVETARTASTVVAAAASGALFGIDPELPFALGAGLVLVGCVVIGVAWRSVAPLGAPDTMRAGEDLLSRERGAGAPESPGRGLSTGARLAGARRPRPGRSRSR